ncbi:alpha/beta hydrolase [Aquihabitans sp. G128]|uniref:alpha/beta fold hydrolase n=1 Tax=Aquihabitans sp. G128 TaxID=2849779 RepID=UPI001C21C43C|nr:alpha/beta hydrolase [Aquihabitans sp. G128]QXC60351.1 alpha/beta hydrolase [Aquihabitans sp. G128]
MNTKKLVGLGATALGIGAAAAGAYRATHPRDAQGPVTPEAGRRAPGSVPDALLDLPADVVHHELGTPDGGVVHAIERGQGRPLVLLHGITLRADVWAPQFHQLADRFRVIAVDLRGHGSSRAGSDGYGIPRLAADLATLLVGLDLHDAIVVGHSMGGMTAMQFCGDFPEVLAERVAGLVFVATRAHQVMPPYVDRLAKRLVGSGQRRLDGGRELPARAAVNERIVRAAFGDRPSKKAIAVVAEMGRSMDARALIPSVDGLIDHDARAALRATDTPSLVVVGTRDLLTPVPSGRHLAHLLPHAELVVLPKAGHQLMQERPTELAELIDAFAAKLAGRQPSVSAAVDASAGPVDADQVEATPEPA